MNILDKYYKMCGLFYEHRSMIRMGKIHEPEYNTIVQEYEKLRQEIIKELGGEAIVINDSVIVCVNNFIDLIPVKDRN